jgi:hypothetical protein
MSYSVYDPLVLYKFWILKIIFRQVEGVIYVLVTSFLTQSATAHEKNIQTCNKAGSSDIDIQDWKCKCYKSYTVEQKVMQHTLKD